jgi:transposase
MHYLGIDVSKATLDVSDPSGDRRLSSANSRPGIRKVIKWAEGKHASNKVIQFVIEPTSTYHHVLLDELSNSDIAFTVINPARTKAYSNSLGRRAKTDRVDAQLLASLGQTQQTAPSHQPERFQEQIKSLRRHRESIEQLILSVRNRIEATTRSPWADSEVVRSLRSTVRHLENQVAAADQRLEKLISEDETYSTISDLLQTIPGVGPKTAQLLISEMPPAWQCSTSRAWVAFAGVCPQPFQSGASSYSRLSRMGSRRVRAGMYMATVASMKSNPAIAELVARLKERGKGGKLIVMAAMNKLIRICYGVIKTRKPFNPTFNIAPKTA